MPAQCRGVLYDTITQSISERSRGEGTLHIRLENQNEGGVRRLTEEECERVFERGVCGPAATATSTGIGLDTVRAAAAAGAGSVRLATRAEGASVYTALHIEMPAEENGCAAGPDRVLARGSAAAAVSVCSSSASSSVSPEPMTPPSSYASADESEASKAEAPASSVAALPHGLSILVADDLPINRIILSYHLASICPGCTIREAASGEEVLRLAVACSSEERPMGFDLFFIDEDMGDGLSGSDVLTRLRDARALAIAKNEDVPPSRSDFSDATSGGGLPVRLVSVTAAGDDVPTTRRLLRAGADLVWNKPLPSTSEMAERLAEVRAAKLPLAATTV